MKLIPTLTTPRLVLRPLTPDDAKDVQRLAGDARVSETTGSIPHPYPDGAAEAWIATHAQKAFEKSAYTWAMCDQHTGALLGCVSLIGKLDLGMELGYWVGVPFWNQGFMTEAAAAVLRCAFEGLGVQRVFARYVGSNVASGRVMQHNNMRFVGTMRQSTRRAGAIEDMVYYELLHQDYLQNQQRVSPILETARLRLRLWTLQDAGVFAALSDDASIADGTLTFLHPQPKGWAKARIARDLESARNGEGFSFAVLRKDTNMVVGSVGLHLNTRHHSGELGYWIASNHRQQGFANEAVRAVVDFGFATLNLHRIHAAHFPRNPASGRVLVHAGLKPEGVLRQAYFKQSTGVFEDTITYSLLREEHQTNS